MPEKGIPYNRVKDIISHLANQTADCSAAVEPASELWQRFDNVRQAVWQLVTQQEDDASQIQRDITVVDYSDDGKHLPVIRGSIVGEYNGIAFNISLQSVIIDEDSPSCTLSPFRCRSKRVKRSKNIKNDDRYIVALFRNKDGRWGRMKVKLDDTGVVYEAYWLKNREGKLRLEQVVTGNGDMFNVSVNPSNKGWITAPGTQDCLLQVIQDPPKKLLQMPPPKT